MRRASIFPCMAVTMVCSFRIFFIFQIFILKFFFTNITDLCIFINNFIFFFLKLIIFIACCLKNSQKFFMHSSPLYIFCLFFMLLNKDIVDIEKSVGICLFTFVVDELSRLFLHPSIFSIIHSRSA